MFRRAILVQGGRSLRRNFLAALAGNVVYAASQFGMLVAIAQLTTATEVGRYALALAVTGPIFIFAGLKLRQVQVTDAGGVNKPGDYFGLRLVTSIVALLAVGVIAVVGPFPAATVGTILAVGAAKALEAQIDVLYGAMQRREQLQLVARSQIARGTGSLLVFVAVLTVWRRVDVAAAALVACTAVPVATNAWRVQMLGVSPRLHFTVPVLARLARLSVPLGISVAIGSLIVNVPRYVVEGSVGTAQLGVFAALAYSLVATGTVANAMVEAALPRLSNMFVSGEAAAFKRTVSRLVVLGALLGLTGVVAAAFVGGPLLRLVFGPQYAAEVNVLVLLMASATVQYTVVFVGAAVNAMRMFTVQAPINAVGLVTVTAVSLLAIPSKGLVGAGLAVLAGELAMAACYAVLTGTAVLPRLALVRSTDPTASGQS